MYREPQNPYAVIILLLAAMWGAMLLIFILNKIF
jgi:hypothetical protein